MPDDMLTSLAEELAAQAPEFTSEQIDTLQWLFSKARLNAA